MADFSEVIGHDAPFEGVDSPLRGWLVAVLDCRGRARCILRGDGAHESSPMYSVNDYDTKGMLLLGGRL